MFILRLREQKWFLNKHIIFGVSARISAHSWKTGLTPSYIEYIALTTAVPFNTGHPSAVSRSRQLKAALQVFSHYKVPLTFRYTWKRLRKRRSKNLIKFPQVYIAFVLQYIHCFEKNNKYWLNESWETRLPKRLKCTIALWTIQNLRICGICALLGTGSAQPHFQSHVKSTGDFSLL